MSQSGDPASSRCCLLGAGVRCLVQRGCWQVEVAGNFRGCIQRGGGVDTDDTVSQLWGPRAGAGRGRRAAQRVPGLVAHSEARAEAAWFAAGEGRRWECAAGSAALLRGPSSQPQASWGHDRAGPVLGDSTASAPPPLTHRALGEIRVVRIVRSDRRRGVVTADVAATAAAEETLRILRREPLRDRPDRPPPRPPAAHSPIRSYESILESRG